MIFLLSVALLLSASSIDQDEASKLVEEVAMEVKAEGTASSKNYDKPSTSKPSSVTTSKKGPNLKDSSSKSAFPKVNGRTRIQRSNTAPGVKPSVSRQSPAAGRRNPSTVSISNKSSAYSFVICCLSSLLVKNLAITYSTVVYLVGIKVFVPD